MRALASALLVAACLVAVQGEPGHGGHEHAAGDHHGHGQVEDAHVHHGHAGDGHGARDHDDHDHGEHQHGGRSEMGRRGHDHGHDVHGGHDRAGRGREDGGGHGHGGHDGHQRAEEWLDEYAAAIGISKRWLGAYVSAISMSVISFAGIILLLLMQSPRLNVVVEYASLAFAGTVLVADALIHLMPHSLEGASHDDMVSVGLSATAGCMAVLAIPELLQGGHAHAGEHGQAGGHGGCHSVQAFGWANLLTEMLHNFADGMSLGVAWMSGTAGGLAAALAVAVHELPQEMGDFMVLRAAGFSIGRLLFWNFVVSLTCVAGVGVVHAAGSAELLATVQRHLMAFTAGSFLALALNMIFPQVSESIRKHHSGGRAALAKLLCAVLGLLAVWSLVRIGDLEAHEHHGHDHSGHSHGHGAEL